MVMVRYELSLNSLALPVTNRQLNLPSITTTSKLHFEALTVSAIWDNIFLGNALDLPYLSVS